MKKQNTTNGITAKQTAIAKRTGDAISTAGKASDAARAQCKAAHKAGLKQKHVVPFIVANGYSIATAKKMASIYWPAKKSIRSKTRKTIEEKAETIYKSVHSRFKGQTVKVLRIVLQLALKQLK